ncbi:unnamed protein product [Parnassius mnemosyne]|uniref:Craniofacial development protein 2-like n=1 Tax=Parnassius mnemosyne TaxID=213953 RepID=A0AAV1M105_9NEOP
MGLSDIRWIGKGKHQLDNNYTMFYSGSDDSSNKYGVGVIINTKYVNTPVNLVPKSNRTMLLRPRNINIIQVYALSTDGSDQEVPVFYKEIEDLLQMTKNHEINLVIGDFNAKVGKGEVPRVAGKFGLGARNERGDSLVQFCQECDFAIINTYFQLPPKRLYTWTSPKHTPQQIVRNQIDYIIINNRFRNCIKSAKTYPGADIRSD